VNIVVNRLDPNLPDPVESRRRSAGRFVRIVYAVIVFGILAALIVYFGRPFVYLSGPGVVSSPIVVVSVPYTAQIREVSIVRGASVEAGQEIAQIWSPQQDDIAATYMRALAEVNTQSADLRIKANAASASMDAARSYLKATEEATELLDTSTVASVTFRLEMLRERSLAQKTVAAQEAELEEAETQLASLDAFAAQLHQQLADLEGNFAGGRIYAPISGIVSSPPARSGQSVVAGTPIAEIRDPTDVYVNWYIPNQRFIDPEVGRSVFIVFGTWRLDGTIEELLPVSEAFGASQPTIGDPREATQIARIRFAAGTTPPAFNTTVQVRMYYTRFMAQLATFFVEVFGRNWE
jgi:multidrug resistance efflux pump